MWGKNVIAMEKTFSLFPTNPLDFLGSFTSAVYLGMLLVRGQEDLQDVSYFLVVLNVRI